MISRRSFDWDGRVSRPNQRTWMSYPTKDTVRGSVQSFAKSRKRAPLRGANTNRAKAGLRTLASLGL